MGRVEDGEPVDHLGVVHRNRPGDRSAPVVTDQPRGLLTELSDEAADVVGEQVDGVVLEALWLRRQVIATGVGGDDSKTRRRERLDLPPPTEPELREAVKQDDQRPLTGLDVVQLDVVADFGVTLTKLGPDVGEQGGGSHETSRVAADSGDTTPADLDKQQRSRRRKPSRFGYARGST